jgi:hypothetical protein
VTGRESFSDDEWNTVRRFPLVAASLISAVDYSSLSEEREFRAFADFIRSAGNRRKKSPLIAELLADTDIAERDMFMRQCQFVSAAMSGDNPVEAALREARDIGKLVDERLPKKAAKTYKSFIIDVALAVARAHKESAFPFAGAISRIEDFHIRRLQTALGV